MGKILTRFGDGYKVELTEDEVRADIIEGTNDAASRAGVDPLKEEEIEHLLDIFKNPNKVVSVEDGKEVVMNDKAGQKVIYSKYAGTEVKVDGDELIIVRQNDILATVE